MRRLREIGLRAGLAVVLGAAGPAASQPAPSPPVREAEIGSNGATARLTGVQLEIGTRVARGEGWEAAWRRLTGARAGWEALREAHGGRAPAPGDFVVLPRAAWPEGLGAEALLALFPGDRVTAGHWEHRVRPGATAWTLAALFTGTGRNAERLLPGGRTALGAGELVRIPLSLVRPELRPAVRNARAEPAAAVSRAAERDAPPGARPARGRPPSSRPVTVLSGSGGLAAEGAGSLAVEPAGGPAEESGAACAPVDEESEAVVAEASPEEEPDFEVERGTRSDDGALAFDADAEGPHAVYRLRAGETLYTHVVLRFTGLLSGRDVNDAALRFARRSGIDDVTEIPVGAPVRIPLADLLPQHLPASHPRRLEWEQERAAADRLARRSRRENLQGVHVVLDAGHGGSDPGAGQGDAWEDDHVYDVAVRVQALLEDRTAARVHPLVSDLSSGHAPLSRIRRDSDEVLLATPPMELDSVPSRVAVNMRWLLANDVRRRLVSDGVGDERIVFLSFHADSLHESATGAMAYYPAARLRAPSCGVPDEPAYRRHAEAADRNAFRMGRSDALRSEGLSRQLAETLVAALRSADVGVHGFTPVRGSIQRERVMVPAVLRYNRIPASVLLEICNLNNPGDRKRLRDPVFRQRVAEAVVDGLVDFFDGRDEPGSRPQRQGPRR